MEKLDGLVEKAVLMLFARIRAIPEGKLVSAEYDRQQKILTGRLKQAHVQKQSKQKELDAYKLEIYKAIQGTSKYAK